MLFGSAAVAVSAGAVVAQGPVAEVIIGGIIIVIEVVAVVEKFVIGSGVRCPPRRSSRNPVSQLVYGFQSQLSLVSNLKPTFFLT